MVCVFLGWDLRGKVTPRAGSGRVFALGRGRMGNEALERDNGK